MQKGDVVLGGFIPAHQDAPEAVQPTVGAFHHPAPGFEPSLSFDGLRLLAPTADVGGEAELVHDAAHLLKVVALVQAQPQGRILRMGLVRTGCRSRHGQAVHRGPHQFHVVAVGPVHRQAHRNALGFSQQAALDAPLASVGGVGAGFSPRPRAIWSWRRPCSTPGWQPRHAQRARHAAISVGR